MDSNPDPDLLYCRLCLDNTIIYPNYVDVKLNKCEIYGKIVKLFNITIDDPELSTFICLPCRDQIQDFIAYMETVAKNQELLQETKGVFIKDEPDDNILEENKNESSNIKVEVLSDTPEDTPLSSLPNDKKLDEEVKASIVDAPHKPREKIKQMFICDYCKETSTSKTGLIRHMREHIKRYHKCDQCEEVLSSRKKLKAHKQEQHALKRGGGKIRYYDKIVDISNYLFCELCEGNPKFETFTLMHEHYLADHGVRGYVLCCGSIFKTQRSVVSHCDRHSAPIDYMCKICQKVLPNKASLKDHLDRHKPDEEKIYECDTCYHRFSRASHLTYHIKMSHNKIPKDRVRCALCNKTYSSKFILEQHIQRVHKTKKELPWICETCGKRCFTEPDLKTHIKYKHTNVGAKCNVCGNFVKNIRQHMGRHEQMKLDIKCDVCLRSIPTFNALRLHMKSHADKKFRCETCGEYFGRKTALQDHMSQHDGIPRHSCDYCHRTFNNSGNKFKHIKQAHFEEHQEEMERKRIMKEQKM